MSGRSICCCVAGAVTVFGAASAGADVAPPEVGGENVLVVGTLQLVTDVGAIEGVRDHDFTLVLRFEDAVLRCEFEMHFAACGADFNGDGSVESCDFFAFLDAFFENDARADMNGDGVTSRDFFEYLDAFIAG